MELKAALILTKTVVLIQSMPSSKTRHNGMMVMVMALEIIQAETTQTIVRSSSVTQLKIEQGVYIRTVMVILTQSCHGLWPKVLMPL